MIAILPINRPDYLQYMERVTNAGHQSKTIQAVTKTGKVPAILSGSYLYNEEKQVVMYDREKGKFIDIVV
jgi:Rad3-related DNA helicase